MSWLITIPCPLWWSSLTSTILDLEKLRSKVLFWDLPPHIFFQLKEIFQILETLWSARIEWNNTTLSEYVEQVLEKDHKSESQAEINNLEEAIQFIEKNTNVDTLIDRAYLSSLHQIVTRWLIKEGSRNPWSLRIENVTIGGSTHIPPDFLLVPELFEEFVKFINYNHQPQNQLLMIAIAHHRFAYIHPFDNGNGRMGRLLIYVLLIKHWFKVKNWRIINPSAVFYSNRKQYYDMLAIADSLKDEDVLSRSEYFLSWLKNEIEKVDSLLHNNYVIESILIPSLHYAREKEYITELEEKILRFIISKQNMEIKSQELDKFNITGSDRKSRIVKNLRDKNMLISTKQWWRIYTIQFTNNYLLRSIIYTLTGLWYISEFLEKNNM